MFTLSNKQRVENSNAAIEVRNAANAEVSLIANISATDSLVIPGFGKFSIPSIKSIKLRRAVAPVLEVKEFDLDAPAGVAIGDSIEVVFSLKTSRYQVDILTQKGIGTGRGFRFNTAPLTAITTTAISAAIVAAYDSYKKQFPVSDLILNIEAGTDASDIKVSLTPGNESVSVEKLEIIKTGQGVASSLPLKIDEVVTASTAVGFEGAGQGKFLEESVRMSSEANTNPFGLSTATTQVDLRGSYTEVFFEIEAEDFLGKDKATHSFNLFLNEANMLGAEQAIAKIATIAEEVAGLEALVTVAGSTDLATDKVEGTEALIIGNTSVATVADFIA